MTVHTWSDNERLYAADLNSSFNSLAVSQGARICHTSAYTLTTAVDTALPFDGEIYDYNAFHSNVTNNTRLTMPVGGVYVFGATIEFASNSTGYRVVKIRWNGAAVYLAVASVMAVNGIATTVSVSGSHAFSTNDYLEVMALQTSGGNLNVTSANDMNPIFWIAPMRGT